MHLHQRQRSYRVAKGPLNICISVDADAEWQKSHFARGGAVTRGVTGASTTLTLGQG